MSQIKGKQSTEFERDVYILGAASIVGQKEGEGPLGENFDKIEQDPMFGQKSWEEAESEMQIKAAKLVLEKCGRKAEDIRMIFAGDLLAQSIASCFGLVDLNRPLYGLYGACSTIGEALSLGAMAVAGGYANYVLSMTSSHFASVEKEFRFPLAYGNQRPPSSSWTVTGSGACIVSSEKSNVKISGITSGKIVDYGLKDSQNMGGCMAPAAADTIAQNLADFERKPEDYDRIITGDLGSIGKEILLELMKKKGYDIAGNYLDCGMLIFDPNTQDTNAGGSGCGCAATVLASTLLPKLESGEWKRILFVPTGALMSKVSFYEGKSVPGIAQGVILEHAGKE
ncbi:stage V sporulation protein AD [Novisyntrophococcus fermenticellae]|uniref:stage V sporulation protein AD n=1 Tax=Novisyntrophococcus fermenticellae TaxID=2068655 RepID=UPI001E5AB1A2|nr:stage V sporulation protein AD [Novisyntrophococcus fermenticellae]